MCKVLLMKRITFWMLVGPILLILAYFVLPKPYYRYASWGQNVDGGYKKFQFSKYLIPETYKYIDYRESLVDRKKIVVYQDQSSDQYFVACILREIPKLDHKKLSIDHHTPRKNLINRLYVSLPAIDNYFELWYFLPFFFNENYSEEYPKVEIKGLETSRQEQFETEKTKVLFIDGKFEKLGFYRISNSPFFKYPMPAFSFHHPMNGTVAIINDKKTGQTIFAFGANTFFKKFNRDEFLEIIKSLTFDKEPGGLDWVPRYKGEG